MIQGLAESNNVKKFFFGENSLKKFSKIDILRKSKKRIFLLDRYFKNKKNYLKTDIIKKGDLVIYIDSSIEPTDVLIDNLILKIKKKNFYNSKLVVAFGGGSTLDTGKAVSNLLRNTGKASDYQGWDLVKKPGVFKIGIPTLSGTGAESSRTCVLTNNKTGKKLGMNSDFSVYDLIVMDPDLTKTVDKNQYFYSGMDSFIHSFESINGKYKNDISDKYANLAKNICEKIFLSKNIKSNKNRSNLMIASYLGGLAIGMSMVGLVHPFSAALSVVFGTKHCISNCIVMRGMREFYPKEYNLFWKMVSRQKIKVPKLNLNLNINKLENISKKLIKSTLIHEKPLTNALGKNFRKVLTNKKMIKIFNKF